LIIAANRPINLGSTEPHNDYIKIVLEMGLIGVGVYLSLIISLLWHLLKAWRQEVWPRRQLLFLFLAVFSLALYGASIGDNILKDSPLQWSFWALIGSLMYSYGQIKKSQNDLATR
jgi:O-antigen ligase